MEQQTQTTLLPNDTLQSDKYRIDKTLGAGGFGITYLATHTILDKKVAIKELFLATRDLYCTRQNTVSKEVTPHFDKNTFQQFRKRFLDEARTLHKFDQTKGIVKVIDTFDENNTSYFVMDFVDGQPLTSIVENDRNAIFHIGKITKYTTQLLQTLQNVHQAGILHRDVKPDNILIDKNDNLVLIDFGIARSYDEGKVSEQTGMATIGYAPPEQLITKAERGAFTDLYSVGGVLYFMCCKMRPQSMDEQVQEGFISAKKRNPNTPDWLDQIITKALQPKTKERYQTAQQFLEALGNQPQTQQEIPFIPNNNSANNTTIDTNNLFSNNNNSNQNTAFQPNQNQQNQNTTFPINQNQQNQNTTINFGNNTNVPNNSNNQNTFVAQEKNPTKKINYGLIGIVGILLLLVIGGGIFFMLPSSKKEDNDWAKEEFKGKVTAYFEDENHVKTNYVRVSEKGTTAFQIYKKGEKKPLFKETFSTHEKKDGKYILISNDMNDPKKPKKSEYEFDLVKGDLTPIPMSIDTSSGNTGNSGNTGSGNTGNSGNTGSGNTGNSGNTGSGNTGNSGNTGSGNTGNSGNTGSGNTGNSGNGNNPQKIQQIKDNIQQFVELNCDFEDDILGMGGFTDIFAFVQKNETGYTIDQINVEVQIIRNNGQLYKKEFATFYNVQQNSKPRIKIPDQEAGKKIRIYMTYLKCSAINFETRQFHYPDKVY